ncbi:Denticleless protein-like protein [Smittium culicis]|uniref:Denticleless protein-like protein n=1 Tax=Smittium culicis TaxID=133412 RepID=A0A1R1YGH0_9FUNG|nr:Denticleless protein-like protein [Smittium culicis]
MRPDRVIYNEILESNLETAQLCSLPTYCTYSNGSSFGLHKAAYSDESGYINLINTSPSSLDPLDYHFDTSPSGLVDEFSQKNSVQIISRFKAHENSIFCFKFSICDKNIISSSADCTLSITDLETLKKKFSFKGHSNTVRSLDTHPSNQNIFVSGGRDGKVSIWDSRLKNLNYRDDSFCVNPLFEIPNAHLLPAYTPSKNNKALNSPLKKPLVKRHRLPKPSFGTPPGITCTLFLPCGNKICSSSSENGIINFFDLRNIGSNLKLSHDASNPLSQKDNAQYGKTVHKLGDRSRGIASMALSPKSYKLYSFSIDNHIYSYDTVSPGSPIEALSDEVLFCNNFYSQISIDKNERYLAAGSSNGLIHLFDINDNKSKLYDFKSNISSSCSESDTHLQIKKSHSILHNGHSNQVCSLSWCPWLETDSLKNYQKNNSFSNRKTSENINSIGHQLLTCSDDYTVRLWDSYTENQKIKSLNISQNTQLVSSSKTQHRKWGFQKN